MTNVAWQLDMPRLPHNAAKGEIVFSALLLRRCYENAYHADVVEVPLHGGYRDQPSFARVDFTAGERHAKVTKVIGTKKRTENR